MALYGYVGKTLKELLMRIENLIKIIGYRHPE